MSVVRDRRRRGRARRCPGGGHRPRASGLSELLRPALELAVDVARAGLAGDPAMEAPRPLRPILRFRQLSAAALASVRRAVDDDEAFRTRVAAAAQGQPDVVGEAGRLFLARPAGWEAALRELEAAGAADLAGAAEEAEERSARRRLPVVEERADRAEAMVRELRAEVVSLRAELVEQRRARHAADAALAQAEGRLPGLERERDAAHRRASALANDVARLERVAREAAGGGTPAGVAPPSPPFAVDAVRAALADAQTAAAVLERSLAAAARALGEAPPATAPRPVPATPREASATVERRLAGRIPVALPPGLHDDDRAAADHLVRLGGTVLVVDGYNATLGRWPDLPIAEQRRRLVDALVGLSARSGAGVHVVFDGVDEQVGRAALARRSVQVTFSARAVEADDVILDVVERLPEARPVVVASDDRRVQREAAARGANVISQGQLFSLL